MHARSVAVALGFLLAFVATLAPDSPAWAANFVFSAPPGWVDLSPGAPVDALAKVPPALLEQLKTSNAVFIAVDLERGDNMQATVQDGTMSVNAKVLEQLATGLAKPIAASGRVVRTIESSIVQVGGVAPARVVFDVEYQGKTITMLQYVLPGDGQFAVLAFASPRERFAQNRPIFDRAASATRGTKEGHPSIDRVAHIASAGAGLLLPIAGVVGLLMLPWIFRNGRSKCFASIGGVPMLSP